MPIEFRCQCGKIFSLQDERAGQELLCSGCGSLVRIPALGVPLPPPEAPAAAGSVARPGSSWWDCPHCRIKVPQWDTRCTRCGVSRDAPDAPPPAFAPAPAQVSPSSLALPPPSFPWDQRERLGFWQAGYDTLLLVLLHPRKAVSALGDPPDLGGALLFYVVFGVTIGLVSAVMNNTVATLLGPDEAIPELGSFVAFGIPAVLMSTLASMAVLPFLSAILTHLGLMACGAQPRGYVMTLVALLYAYAACMVLQLVPILGVVVGLVWYLVIYIAALAEVHDCGIGKAVIAVLIWPLLLCCCISLIFFFATGIRVG